jgi:hypothetical protein
MNGSALLLCALLSASPSVAGAALSRTSRLNPADPAEREPVAPAAYAGLRCPAAPLQDPALAARFEAGPFLGLYYEVELHDYTQPAICGCTTANKTQPSSGVIDDDFVLVCPAPAVAPGGKAYPSLLSFNLTAEPGVFVGTWPLVPDTLFPDTVVAVGWPDDPTDATAPYRWALEFQCVEKAGHVVFVGVNFYARETVDTPEGLRSDQEMQQAAAAFGVYEYTGGPEGMTAINHTGCP